MNFSNLKMHLEQGQTQDSLAQRAWISVYNWVVLSTTEELRDVREELFASRVFALKKIWLGLKD